MKPSWCVFGVHRYMSLIWQTNSMGHMKITGKACGFCAHIKWAR